MGTKRTADAALPASITMSIKDGNAPVPVYFPSGFNPEKAGVDCQFEAYKYEKKKNQYAIVAKTSYNVDFLGTTANAEHNTALACRYALGVFDRSKGTLEIAPTVGGRVLRMEPRARDIDYTFKDTNPSGAVTTNELQERRERNARLVQEFGSQRRKRQLAAAKSAQVEASQVSGGEAVLGMIASAGADLRSRDAVIAASLADRNIPPHHADGVTAEDAYRMDEIVPTSVSDALEILKLFPAVNKPEYRAELRKNKVFGDGYVLTRLSVLETSDKEVRENRARCLVMLGHLLKLLASPAGSVIRIKPNENIKNAADKLCMHSSVLEGIVELFYSVEAGEGGIRYVLSKEKRNLMLGWALILAIRAEPQSVLDTMSFASLSTELKMLGRDVAAMYRELGCVTVRVSGENSGTKVSLMPSAAEKKTLADYFPGLKLGGKKRN